jgi:membrane dipeptidase
MSASDIPLVKEVGRVPSMTVPLDREQELRFQRHMEETIMVDLHEHPMVFPEDLTRFVEYLREGKCQWGFEAVKHGGWTAVATANCLRGFLNTHEVSYISFEGLLEEIGEMLADVGAEKDVIKVTTAAEIESAKQQGKTGFLPTVEHLAIGYELDRLDLLHSLGIRIAGLTYNRRNYIGDGCFERVDGGLSGFGIEVVSRMNSLGMVVDISHASYKTAMDAIEFSEAPVSFSHSAAKALWQAGRTKKDDELIACAEKGGVIGIIGVANTLSQEPHQDINVALNHYDYMVNLVGVDHVAIGSDVLVGDHVGFHKVMMGKDVRRGFPADYLDGLESPADGKNIIRGLISRGYSDEDVSKIAGKNALAFFRRVMG